MHFIWVLFKILFWIIVPPAFLYSFLTHFILWMELRLLALTLNHEDTIAIPHWSKLFKSFCFEFCCTVFNIVLYPFGFLSFQNQKQTRNVYSPSAIPILFVHGYLHNQMAWFWFIRQLQKKPDIGPLYSINLFPPGTPIAELAELLKDKINDIQLETGSSQVILVGHSVGGIICSYFCEYIAKPKEIAMVITLAAPFKGTRTAALGFGQSPKEISPNSPFLTELTARIQQSSVPYYSIAGKIDNIIIPWQSALLSDEVAKRTQLILEDHGHLRLLISPLAIEQVAEWILNGD